MADIYMDVDAALGEVPVNILPLLDDTDFKTRETAVAFNAAGMDLVWNFVTTAGAFTQTAVTPTSGGAYDWTHQGDGMYTIEIPASGGASINNDTEGFGWFTGLATGVLPWRGPIIGFRASGINDKLIDSAYSATRGLAGTALPDAAADAAGGLPISDAGGLDLDAQIGTDIDAILVDTGTTLQGELDGIQADTEDIQSKIGTPAVTLAADIADVEGKVDDLESRIGTPSDLGSGATVAANLVDIESQTDDIGVAGAGLTDLGGMSTTMKGQVQAEANDALVAIHLDHLLAAEYDPQSKPGDPGALLNEIVESDDASPARARFTAGALEEAPTGGSAPTVGEIADAVWDEATAGHTTGGTFGEQLKTDVDAILVDTAEIGAAGAGLTAVPWNASWDPEVQSEVQDAIEVNHLDHLLAVDYDPQSKPGAAGALLNEMVESDDASPARARFTAGALEEAPTGGSAPTVGEIADAVWDEATAGHTTSGTFGEQAKTDIDAILADTNELQTDWVNGGRLDLILDARASQTTADAIETDTQDIQSRLPAALSSGRMDSSVGSYQSGLAPLQPTVSGRTLDVNAGGEAGVDLDNTSGALAKGTDLTGFNDLDAAGVRSAVGLASANLDTQLEAIDNFLDTEIAAIKTVTDQFTAAQSEPSSVPAANATPLQKIAWLACLARNKVTQTSTTQTLRNDADSGNVATASVSDDGTTFVRAEWT